MPYAKVYFNPGASVQQGQPAEVSVAASSDLARIDVWGYNPVGEAPTSEIGWTMIAALFQGETKVWQTGSWAVGRHAIGLVGHSAVDGKVVLHWNQKYAGVAAISPLEWYDILATTAPAVVAPPVAAPVADMLLSPGASIGQGEKVSITVQWRNFPAWDASIEVWGYNQAGEIPTTETGWTRIGTGRSGGAAQGTLTLTWSTGNWSVGRHALALIARSPQGDIFLHWASKYAQAGIATMPLVWYEILAVRSEPAPVTAPIVAPSPPPETGSAEPESPPGTQETPWGAVVVLGAVAAGAFVLLMRGREA